MRIEIYEGGGGPEKYDYVDAVVKLRVPKWMIGREVEVFYFDMQSMSATGTCEAIPKGKWELLDECSNEGVYCSICHKKVYRKEYANQKVKSNFCPNCGADMRGEE